MSNVGILAEIKPDSALVIAIVGIIILLLIVSSIKIVPQAHAYVIERLGVYQKTCDTGVRFKIPFIDRIAKRVSL